MERDYKFKAAKRKNNQVNKRIMMDRLERDSKSEHSKKFFYHKAYGRIDETYDRGTVDE